MDQISMINYVAALFLSSGIFIWFNYRAKIHYLLSCIGLLEISGFVNIEFSSEDDIQIIIKNLRKSENAIKNNLVLLIILSVAYVLYVAQYITVINIAYFIAPLFPLIIALNGNAIFAKKYKKFNINLNKYKTKKRG